MRLDALKQKVIREIIELYSNISKGKAPNIEFIIEEIEVIEFFNEDKLIEFYLTHSAK